MTINNGKIACILTLYKRPHILHEQLAAVRAQTVKPEKILIWRNGTAEVPADIRADKDLTIIDSSENFGVWGRFAAALLVNTEYICIFDDDTIPGNRWFENCLKTIKEVNGLLGTHGLIFDPAAGTYFSRARIGWPNPQPVTVKVDIVGHSWFFRREWLQYLWTNVPDYETQFLRAGEDFGFSWALQKVGIGTYVPPHTHPETFGSNPEKAKIYGVDDVAISRDGTPHIINMFHYYRTRGFRLVDEEVASAPVIHYFN